MVTEMITLKLEDKFLKEIDRIVEKEGYQNRTEFIRMALRVKVDDIKYKEAYALIAPLRGSSKRHITEEEYENAREAAFWKTCRQVQMRSSGLKKGDISTSNLK